MSPFMNLNFIDMPRLDILIATALRIEELLVLIVDGTWSDVKPVVIGTVRAGEPPPEILRKVQVMDLLKISESTYYRHINSRLLIPRKLGKQNYFKPEDLIKAMEYSRIHGYL